MVVSSSAPPLAPPCIYIRSVSLSVRFSVLRSWWSAGSGPGAWTLPCGPLTPPSSSLWAAAEPCTSSSGWVRHGRPGPSCVWCARWAFHASRGCSLCFTHQAPSHLSVHFPHALCSIWGVWVIWDALCGTAWFLLWKSVDVILRLSIQRGFSLSTAHGTKPSLYFSFTDSL